MANITITTAANLIPEIWGPMIIRAYNVAQKFRPLVQDLEFVGKAGDTIHIPTITSLTADNKVANTDLTPVSNTEGKVDVLIDKNKAKLVTVEDMAAVQASFPLLSIYATEIGGCLGRAIDSDLANLVASCDTEVDATTTTAANMHKMIIELKQTFDVANAPEAGRILAVTPYFLSQLLLNDLFISKDYIGDVAAVASGVVGMIYGFTVVVSNALPSDGGFDSNWAFVKPAIGLAVQRDIAMETGRHLRGLESDVVGSVIYGVKILNQAGTVRLKTKTTEYAG
jgi:N4-gp56 family major capsid protein|tara:strand:- start:143 stop:991 length:849 start_codon:yes stop_codon:yes gene_type:complete